MIEYLKNITEPAAKEILKNAGKVMEWECDGIIRQNGKAVVDIDKRLEAKVTELENLVRKKKTIMDAYDAKAAEIAKFDDKIKVLNNTLKGLRKNYEAYQVAESKYERTKDDQYKEQMDKYKSVYEMYQKTEKEISDLEEKKAPHLKEIGKINDELKGVEKGYGRSGRDSYNHWLAMISKHIEKLGELQKAGETTIARGMEQNKAKFVGIFTNPNEVQEIVKIIESTLVGMTKGRFRTVGKQFQEEYFFNTLNDLKPNDYLYLPFEGRINEKEKCRKVITMDGKSYIIYDLDELPESSVRKGFYAVLQMALQTVGLKHMNRMFYESKNFESYKENEKEEMSTDAKRVNRTVEENGIFSNPNERGFKKKQDTSEMSDMWKKIAKEIDKQDEKSDMADTVYESALTQLPENSYYRSITEDKAKQEFISIFNKLVSLYGTNIENAGEVKSSDVKKYISTTGSITEEDKKILGAVISCVFNMKILELLEQSFKDRVKKEKRDMEQWEENFVRNIGNKYKNLTKGLYNYKMVRASRRAAVHIDSNKVVREAIAVLQEDFKDPTEVADKLLREKLDY